METLKLFKRVLACLESPDLDAIKLSLNDVHSNGIFSLVVSGTEPGRLLRVFIADRKLKPYEVQLHTHRYPINLVVVTGNITHFVTEPGRTYGYCKLPVYGYKSFLNGGNGLTYLREQEFKIDSYKIPPGSSIHLDVWVYHTMACSKGSIWIVEELGFKLDHSLVLGIPFVTTGLYNKPEMFQINDKCQLVMTLLREKIKAFESIPQYSTTKQEA